MRNSRILPSLAIAAIVSVVAGIPLAAAVAPASATPNRDTRAELVSYFENIGTNSPTVLGALQKSPETVDAIRARIDAMSEEEVAELATMMAEMPSWQIAPEALAESLPVEMRQQLTSAGRYYATRANEVEALRNDAFTLIAVAKLLPKEQLAKLGIDAESVRTMEATLGSLDPLQTAMLQERLARESQWAVASRAAIESLPASVQKGASALAAHGALTQQDLAELDAFRRWLMALAGRVDALPQAVRKGVSVESITALRGQIEAATPDMLFMIRAQLTDEQIATMETSVALLERVTRLSDEESAKLEAFRDELRTALATNGSDVSAEIDGLRADQLLVLQDAMSLHPEWRGVMPIVTKTLGDPAVEQTVRQAAAIEPGSPRALELEKFRSDAILYVRASEGAPGVTPEAARKSLAVLQSANLAGLALIREAALRMPADAPPSALVSVPALVAVQEVDLNCVVSLGSIDLPLGIGTVSLGSIDFNWICTPLENAINAVESVVNSVVTIATQIWNFVQTIPQLAVNAIKAAFNALLDIEIANGVTLRALLTQGVDSALAAMKQALGLAGSWWTTIQGMTLPEIPCPPRNTWTPFGQVGSSDAVRNYNKYKFVMDKLIGMIPDTEVSLPVKISAQVLYAGFEYLGVCLDIEANAVDEEATEARWVTSETNQTATLTAIGAHDVTMTNQHTALSNQLSVQGANLSTLVENESLTIQTAVQTASDLALRLAIEACLQAGEGKELATFQLPRPWGRLELVRQIVRESIDGTLAVGGVVNQAGKYLANGDDLYAKGRYKEAFEEFQKAYRELTR